MPKVQSYRKSAGSGALQPVRAGTDMSLASQEAVMRSGLPDGTAARAQRDMSMAGVQRGRQAAELMAAGAKLNEMGGRETARVADMSARAERLALDSSAQILTAMGARFVKMQEDHDAAEVMEAANEWHEYVNQYFNDPEKGMKATRQLANAKGLYDDTSKYLEVVTERCAQNLRTPQQKQAFLKSVAGSRLSAEEKASVYEAQEMGKYAKQTTQQTVQSAIASVAEDPTPTNFNANFERARDAVLFYMRGADEESQRIAVEGLRSDFHAGIITNRMQTDPITAEKYFEQVKGEILPEARVKLEQDVRNAALEIKARAEAEVLLSQYGEDGMTEALAAVREAHAGPEAEDYAKYVKSVFGEAKTARAERETEAFDNIVGMIRRGEPLHRINDAIEAVPWARKATVYQLEDMRDRRFGIGAFAPDGSGGGRIKSDPAAVRELTDLKMTGKLTERFPTWESFREAYESRLAPSKYEEYANIWLDASGKKRSREAAHINASAAYYADHFIEKYHINNEGKQALFRDEMNRSLDAHRAKYGKEPTHSEIYQMAEALGEWVVIEDRKYGPDVKVRRYEINTSGAENTTVVNGELWVQDMDSPSGWSRYRRSE